MTPSIINDRKAPNRTARCPAIWPHHNPSAYTKPMFNNHAAQGARILFGLIVLTANHCIAQSQVRNIAGCVAYPRDAAAAAQLFHEGYKLREEGNDDAACRKFEESARLDPMAGTLINLAECRANQGKIATASGWYHKAVTLAQNQSDKALLDKATEHARELDAELSYLKIQVEKPLPGLEIRRDDEVIGPAQLNEPLPIDPGEHTIVATAPGYKSVTLSVHVGEVADNKTVMVPPMEPMPPAAPPPRESPPPAPTPLQRQQPTSLVRASPWPWVIGGVGASAIVVGGVSGVLALHDKSRVEQRCNSIQGCQDPQTYALQNQRDVEWTVARVTFPIGIAALGAAVTWLTIDNGSRKQPKFDSPVAALGASADRQGAELWVNGRF